MFEYGVVRILIMAQNKIYAKTCYKIVVLAFGGPTEQGRKLDWTAASK